MRRSQAAFLSGNSATGDNVLFALNDSRKQAQQMYDWQALRTTGAIHLNGAAGGPWGYPIANFGPYTSDSGTAFTGALRLKKIDSIWNYSKDTSGNMLPTNRIDFATEQQYKHLLPTNMGYPFTQVYPSSPPYYYNTIPAQQMFAFVVGTNLYVNTCNAASWFMIRALQLLPDLDGSETSDFFIDNYQTWLLYATIQNLNGFLKEDQRIILSNTIVQAAWNAATFQDGGQGAMGEWSNLD